MSPDEMVKLCCDPWISSDHVHWLPDNPDISHLKTLSVNIDHTLNVEALVAHSLPDGQSKPTSLFFGVNVGKDSSDSVFIAMGSG